MILFCDTSALVKLYVLEAGSAETKRLVEEAAAVAVSRIAWAEAYAAFARRERESRADQAAIDSARVAFARDWPSLVVTEVSQHVVETAGEYAQTFGLRAYDSIQLASAKITLDLCGQAVTFACFDSRLNRAAAILDMTAPFSR